MTGQSQADRISSALKMFGTLLSFVVLATAVSAQSAVYGQCGGIGWSQFMASRTLVSPIDTSVQLARLPVLQAHPAQR